MQTTIPLFFFLLYFPEHSLTTHKGPCLAIGAAIISWFWPVFSGQRLASAIIMECEMQQLHAGDLTSIQAAKANVRGRESTQETASLGRWTPRTWTFLFCQGEIPTHPLHLLKEDDQLVLQYSSCKSCLCSHSFQCTHEPKAGRRSFLLQLPSWLQTSHIFFICKVQKNTGKIDHQIMHINEEMSHRLLK